MKITLKKATKLVKEFPALHYTKKDVEKGIISKERFKKMKMQRKKYGFSFEETWNLGHTLAVYILPRLIMLRDSTHGYPGDFSSLKEWKLCTDKMIKAFYLIIGEWSIIGTYSSEQDADIKEGLRLFGQYFLALWD